MKIVIIGQNEGKHMPAMLKALRGIFPEAGRVWVLDRCSDSSEDYLEDEGEFYVKTPDDLKGRQVSYARNLGLQYTDNDDVLFLDGDRVPSLKGTPDFSKADISLITLEWDIRNLDIPYEESYGHFHNMFYTCGIYMSRKAIEAVKDYSRQAIGEACVFDPLLGEYWGIEDTYLGDICYHLGLTARYEPAVVLSGGFSRTALPVKHALMRLERRQHLKVKDR